MDCWIGVTRDGEHCAVRLAGRLTGAQVPELLKACRDCPTVELNLTDLLSADPAGIDAIRRIRSAGAAMVGANGYILMKLESAQASG